MLVLFIYILMFSIDSIVYVPLQYPMDKHNVDGLWVSAVAELGHPTSPT